MWSGGMQTIMYVRSKCYIIILLTMCNYSATIFDAKYETIALYTVS